MKISFNYRRKSESGYALLMVLVLGAISVLIMGAALTRTANTANLNARNNQFIVSLHAAEAATEKVIARMLVDYRSGSDSSITGNLSIYRGTIPSTNDDAYWANFQFSDGQGNQNQTYVQSISNRTYAPLQSQYYGLNGWRSVYRVLSNAKQTKNTSVSLTNAVQQDVELDSIPVFQFAIFYNSLLEFTWAAPLTVRGRTHANGNIYLGSASALTFNATVTTTGTISKPAWDGHSSGEYTGSLTYNGSPGYSTNVPVLQLPIGTNNTAAAVREIVNAPPAGESVTSPIGQQRYYNKAGVVMSVSNTVVTVILKSSSADASPTTLTSTTNISALATNFPFLVLTNTFYDSRESKTVLATQIDVAKYGKWLLTNASVVAKFPSGSGISPNILYVADNRSASGTQLPAIRLTNGVVVPTNAAPSGAATGFTLATPNPLYIWGHYNCPDSTALGSTNTSKTFPASLISDSLTILSSAWADSKSTLTLDNRNDAVSTTVNAAILTGVVYSTGSGATVFSGGVMNLPRLLEDWGNGGAVTLTLNTSIVNFYNSVKATAQFQNPGTYYYAPTRNFNFDQNFTDSTKQPPGTPLLGVILRASWANPPPRTVTYTVH